MENVEEVEKLLFSPPVISQGPLQEINTEKVPSFTKGQGRSEHNRIRRRRQLFTFDSEVRIPDRLWPLRNVPIPSWA